MTTCPNLRTFSMFTTLPPLSTQMTPPISQYGLPTMLHDDSPAQEIEWSLRAVHPRVFYAKKSVRLKESKKHINRLVDLANYNISGLDGGQQIIL
ncbi:hypothetical protein BGZ76_002872 [Entomortierella beljakovae]|nr:hypothetical protein BGZ76_002872 [Entomortierella beljakovae]